MSHAVTIATSKSRQPKLKLKKKFILLKPINKMKKTEGGSPRRAIFPSKVNIIFRFS